MKKLIFTFVAVLFLNSLGIAQIYSNGTGGGDWDNGATWEDGVAPVDGDVVIILDGDVVDGPNTIIKPHELYVNDGGTLDMNDQQILSANNDVVIEIAGTLTNVNKIKFKDQLNSTVTVKSTGTISSNTQNLEAHYIYINDGGSIVGVKHIHVFDEFIVEGTVSAKQIHVKETGVTIEVKSTGSLSLSEKFDDKDKTGLTFTVDGELDVTGELDLSESTTGITGTGSVTAGSYDLGPGAEIFGNSSPVGGTTYYGSNHWTGDTDSDWTLPANWATGVPASTDDVTITDGANDPIISTAIIVKDLVIYSGATLTVDPTGQFTATGTVTNNTGVTGIVLKSTDAGTGSLIYSTSSVGGTIERYLTKRVWHYISTPILYSASTYFDDLNMGLTGGENNDQFYRWNEVLDGWIDILNGADGTGNDPLMDEEVFNLGQGYAVNYQLGDGAKTLSLSGKMNVANKTFAITRNTSATTFTGANLVGNPFTATVAINTGADATNNFLSDNSAALLDDYESVYLWNEQAGYIGDRDDYVAFNNASGATFIEPGQGFMVIAASNTNLSFNADTRKHGTATFYKNSGDDASRFELRVVNPEEETNTTLIAFIPGMTNGLDPSYDGGKLFGNPNLGLYTKLVEDNGTEFAIQALPPSNEETTVKVGLKAEIIGQYTFKPKTIENFPDDASIILEDKQTGSMIDFSDPSASYTFNLDSQGDVDDRFELHFKSVVGINDPIAQNENINTYVSNNTLYVEDEGAGKGIVSIFNMMGQQVLQESYSLDYNTIELSNIPTGHYIVRVASDGSVASTKVHIR